MRNWPMSRMKDEPGDVEVSRLLAGAAKMIGSVRYCWLVTESEAGGVNARDRMIDEFARALVAG